jgi:import inner membrane translocase subunit TIM17
MSAPDQTREPCPDRILDDIGGAFGMGAVGGSVFHFVKGMKNSPNGERLLGGAQAIRMNAPRIGGSFAVWGGLFSVFDCSMVYVRQKEDPWNSIFAGAATGGFLQTRHGVKAASRAALFGGVLLALIEGAGLMINRVLANMAQLPPPPMEQPTGLPAGVFLPGQMPPSTPPPSSSSASPEPESSWTSWMGGIFGSKNEEISAPSSSSSSSSSEVLSASSNPSSADSGWAPLGKGFFGAKKEEKPSASSGETLASFETSSGPAMPTFDYK